MNKVPIKRRPNYDIVLRNLRNGAEVEFPDGYKYALIDGVLCFEMKVWKHGRSPIREPNEPDEIRWVECQMTFNRFMNQCEKFTEEDILGIVFQNTLGSMKKDR